MSSLLHLLAESRDGSSEVARRWDPAARTDRAVTWAELRAQVAALRERIAGQPDGPWILLTEDAYAFAVGLLALWHSGRHAISPPNHQPGALRALQTRSVGVLSDRPDWFPESPCVDPLSAAGSGSGLDFDALRPDAAAVELFTSGTTGEEKALTKRIRHLDDEVRELAATWDALLGRSVVFVTASHQHLYGLLFGVLWPLCAGRVFQAEHFLHAGELVPRMRDVGPCALASVPTHLKRLARSGDLAELRGTCRVVFSSGGPLAADTAHRVAGVLGRAPIEALGSTETGGIAWRTQEAGQGESLWTPFPSVSVTREPGTGVARVHSPFASVDEDGRGFETSDRVSLMPDGRFRLEGRADRVVKVGEKRLDLAQMESQLRGNPRVAEVALAVIDRDGEARVAAAVVPSETGWQLLQRDGRRALTRELQAGLALGWDPILHPRLWRTVEKLPENAQGKVTLDGLRDLFREPEQGPRPSDRPEVLEERRGDDFIEQSCRVPKDLASFAGHFPDAAVVPGVLQLDWAMELAAELLDAAPHAEEIESLKFRSPLEPGDAFHIRVSVRRCRLDFRIWNGPDEHGAGRLLLGAPGSDAA